MPNYDCVPAHLKQLANWVVWRFVQRDPTKKPTKQPLNPNSRLPASVTNPEHWGTFDEACAAFAANERHGPYAAAGIGFVLTKAAYTVFIDLDQPGDPAAHQWILANVPGYVERSPSGTGLHILTRGVWPGRGRNVRSIGVEVYDTERFFTVTGDYVQGQIPQSPPDSLHALYAQLNQIAPDIVRTAADGSSAGSGPDNGDDRAVYDMCANSSNGELFKALWHLDWRQIPGKTYGSQSDADQAMVNMLVRRTDSAAQVERMLLSLPRTARKGNPEDYARRTVADAYASLPPVPLVNTSGIMSKLQAMAVAEQNRLEGMRVSIADKYGDASDTDNLDDDGNTLLPYKDYEAQILAQAPAYEAGAIIDYPQGMVGEVARFMHQAANYPMHMAAIVGALAFMAGICGKAYNVNRTGLNLYLLFLAESGAGKSAIGNGMNRLAAAFSNKIGNMHEIISTRRFSSGQGILEKMAATPFCAVIWSEFWTDFKTKLLAQNTSNDSINSVRTHIQNLFHSSGKYDVYGGTANADKDKSKSALFAPALTIVGETATDELLGMLNEGVIKDGMLPRWLIVETKEYRTKKQAGAAYAEPSPELVNWLSVVLDNVCQQLTQPGNVKPVMDIVLPPDVQARYDDYDETIRKMMKAARDQSVIRLIWNRVSLKTLRIAALLAIGRTPDGVGASINHDDLTWAMRFVHTGTMIVQRKYEMDEIGTDIYRVIADVKRTVAKYVAMPYASLPKGMQTAPELHAQSIIGHAQIQRGVGRTAAIREHKQGPIAALRDAIGALRDEGVLIDVTETMPIKRPGRWYRVNREALE